MTLTMASRSTGGGAEGGAVPVPVPTTMASTAAASATRVMPDPPSRAPPPTPPLQHQPPQADGEQAQRQPGREGRHDRSAGARLSRPRPLGGGRRDRPVDWNGQAGSGAADNGDEPDSPGHLDTAGAEVVSRLNLLQGNRIGATLRGEFERDGVDRSRCRAPVAGRPDRETVDAGPVR